ncbi:MAG: LytTR family transcriptional regulator DNA-binding domain-containing protein [Bacteroidales bacterium]|nr:LytTR family transcriptional regulator DNA-binding domain-containing protein [Bacteroidales bacterium]
MEPTKYLFFNSRDELYRLEVANIVFFEGEGNYTNIMLCNKQKAVICMGLSRMQDVLSLNLREEAQRFARIGKRFIVNLDFIYHIEVQKQRLVLSDGRLFAFALPVSKEALRKLKEIYTCAEQ